MTQVTTCFGKHVAYIFSNKFVVMYEERKSHQTHYIALFALFSCKESIIFTYQRLSFKLFLENIFFVAPIREVFLGFVMSIFNNT